MPSKPKPKQPLSRARFAAKAEPLTLSVGKDMLGEAKPKTHKSGSLGFFFAGKQYMKIGGKDVVAQVNLTITIIGSKEAPDRTPDDDGIVPTADDIRKGQGVPDHDPQGVA